MREVEYTEEKTVTQKMEQSICYKVDVWQVFVK